MEGKIGGDGEKLADGSSRKGGESRLAVDAAHILLRRQDSEKDLEFFAFLK